MKLHGLSGRGKERQKSMAVFCQCDRLMWRTALEWCSGDVVSSPSFATKLPVTLDKSLNISEISFLFLICFY